MEADDAEILLETRIPVVEGMDPMPIGQLLDDAVLILLNLRRSDWSGGGAGGGDYEGSRGEADICWQALPGGEILTSPDASLRPR